MFFCVCVHAYVHTYIHMHTYLVCTYMHAYVMLQALKSCDKATKPVYISIGHQVSLDTAVWVATTCSKYRIPEPVRQVCTKKQLHFISLLYCRQP